MPRSSSRERDHRDRTVRVSNLSRNVSDEHLIEIFRHYGPIVAVDMPLAPHPAMEGLPVGHAFITYEDHRDAEDAEDCMDDGIVDGEHVTVELVPTRDREGARQSGPIGKTDRRRGGGPPPRGGDVAGERRRSGRSRSRSPERGHGRRDRSR
jgi:RNA recognition motif-containing protein